MIFRTPSFVLERHTPISVMEMDDLEEMKKLFDEELVRDSSLFFDKLGQEF